MDKDNYVRYTRGTGGRGAALLQGEYTYAVGQIYDPSAAYMGAPIFYAPHAYAAIPNQFRIPGTKGPVSTRGLVRSPSVRGGSFLPLTIHLICLLKSVPDMIEGVMKMTISKEMLLKLTGSTNQKVTFWSGWSG